MVLEDGNTEWIPLWWVAGDVYLTVIYYCLLSYSCSSIFSVNLAPKINVTLETLKSRLKTTKSHQFDGRSTSRTIGKRQDMRRADFLGPDQGREKSDRKNWSWFSI